MLIQADGGRLHLQMTIQVASTGGSKVVAIGHALTAHGACQVDVAAKCEAPKAAEWLWESGDFSRRRRSSGIWSRAYAVCPWTHRSPRFRPATPRGVSTARSSPPTGLAFGAAGAWGSSPNRRPNSAMAVARSGPISTATTERARQ